MDGSRTAPIAGAPLTYGISMDATSSSPTPSSSPLLQSTPTTATTTATAPLPTPPQAVVIDIDKNFVATYLRPGKNRGKRVDEEGWLTDGTNLMHNGKEVKGKDGKPIPNRVAWHDTKTLIGDILIAAKAARKIPNDVTVNDITHMDRLVQTTGEVQELKDTRGWPIEKKGKPSGKPKASDLESEQATLLEGRRVEHSDATVVNSYKDPETGDDCAEIPTNVDVTFSKNGTTYKLQFEQSIMTDIRIPQHIGHKRYRTQFNEDIQNCVRMIWMMPKITAGKGNKADAINALSQERWKFEAATLETEATSWGGHTIGQLDPKKTGLQARKSKAYLRVGGRIGTTIAPGLSKTSAVGAHRTSCKALDEKEDAYAQNEKLCRTNCSSGKPTDLKLKEEDKKRMAAHELEKIMECADDIQSHKVAKQRLEKMKTNVLDAVKRNHDKKESYKNDPDLADYFSPTLQKADELEKQGREARKHLESEINPQESKDPQVQKWVKQAERLNKIEAYKLAIENEHKAKHRSAHVIACWEAEAKFLTQSVQELGNALAAFKVLTQDNPKDLGPDILNRAENVQAVLKDIGLLDNTESLPKEPEMMKEVEKFLVEADKVVHPVAIGTAPVVGGTARKTRLDDSEKNFMAYLPDFQKIHAAIAPPTTTTTTTTQKPPPATNLPGPGGEMEMENLAGAGPDLDVDEI